MKKTLGIVAIAIFFFSPFFASAAIIGTAQLEVHWSPPTGGGYYLDYDGYMTIDGDRSWVEMFCVEYSDAPHDAQLYTLLSIDDSLATFGLDPVMFKKAAWIADNYAYSTDTMKGEAQKAIWDITNVMHIVGASGGDYNILASLPSDMSSYSSIGWALAVNPQIDIGDMVNKANFQNYLVPYSAPVPEPTTLFLLGTGLIGLAGFGRKKLKK